MELGVSFGVSRRGGARFDGAQGGALAGVLLARWVIARTAAHEEEVARLHGGHRIFMRGRQAAGPAADMMEEQAVVVPTDRRRGLKQRPEREAFELRAERGREGCPGEVAERREDVQVGRQIRHRVRLPFPGPFPEGDGPRAALPDGAFAAPHTGVEDIQPVGLAVVVHEDEDRVVLQFTLPEMLHQPSEVVVEVGDHTEIRGLLVVHLAAEWRHELRGGGQRRMGRIGGEIAEEGGILALIDEGHGLVEKDVLPEAFPRFALAVADHGRVEVHVRTADIGGGPFEPALLRSIVAFAAQMPLADEARAIACGPQDLRQKDGILVQVFSRQGGVRDAVAELVHARQERRARRRAGRTHVELFEAHALVVQRVEIRRLE